MTELMEEITAKLNKAKDLHNSLNEIKNYFQKLEDSEKLCLPKFEGKFDEKSLSEYLGKLKQAVKNPIRFRRKMALSGLRISGIENVKDEIFDDDNVDETIQILTDIQPYERLFKILSTEISSWVIQNSITDVNLRLKDIRNNVKWLKEIEYIRSEDVKNYILRKYISKELNVNQIGEFKVKTLKIEKVLNILIKESEILLINEVYEFIKEIEEFGGKFEEQYSDLMRAKVGLEEIKEDLKQQYEKIESEINFWQRLYPGIYVPESKKIDILANKLKELKDKSREKHKSFNVLEQLFAQRLHDKIESLEDFAYKLDKVISYLPDIKIKSDEVIGIIEELHEQLSWLEEIEYPQIKELFGGLTFENAENFLKKVEWVKEEYERLKRDLSNYQRMLRIGEEEIDKYHLLKQKVDEYKKKLQNDIGEGFDSLIRFLKGETEDIEADEETLRNFIKVVKPFLKEMFKI